MTLNPNIGMFSKVQVQRTHEYEDVLQEGTGTVVLVNANLMFPYYVQMDKANDRLLKSPGWLVIDYGVDAYLTNLSVCTSSELVLLKDV